MFFDFDAFSFSFWFLPFMLLHRNSLLTSHNSSLLSVSRQMNSGQQCIPTMQEQPIRQMIYFSAQVCQLTRLLFLLICWIWFLCCCYRKCRLRTDYSGDQSRPFSAPCYGQHSTIPGCRVHRSSSEPAVYHKGGNILLFCERFFVVLPSYMP